MVLVDKSLTGLNFRSPRTAFLVGNLAVVFLLTTIVALAGGCSHACSRQEGATAASKGATATPNEVSEAFIGKQITIRGQFSLRGKVGAYILLDNKQAVYLVSRGSFTWGAPYSEMEGKLVAATGTLKFYHEPPAEPTDRAVARLRDYFYFEVETTQLRLISH